MESCLPVFQIRLASMMLALFAPGNIASFAVEYNCQEDLQNRKTLWSTEKMIWCCGDDGVGCLPRKQPTSQQPTAASTTLLPMPTTPPRIMVIPTTPPRAMAMKLFPRTTALSSMTTSKRKVVTVFNTTMEPMATYSKLTTPSSTNITFNAAVDGATAAIMPTIVMSCSKYSDLLATRLREAPKINQVGIALVAVALGVLLAYDGPAFWGMIFTISTTLMVMFDIYCEISTVGNITRLAPKMIVTVFGGGLAALTVHLGFEASQLLFSTMLGFSLTYHLKGWITPALESGFLVLLHVIGILSCILVFHVLRRPFLATLAPLFGSFLVATGIAFLLTQFKVAMVVPHFNVTLLPPPDAPWSTSAAALFGQLGSVALMLYGWCAVLAALLHELTQSRAIAMTCIGSCFLTTMLANSVGPFAVEAWQWPLCGCILWALFALPTAWRQLGTQVWEATKCWEWGKTGSLHERYNLVQSEERAENFGRSPFRTHTSNFQPFRLATVKELDVEDGQFEKL